MNRIVYGERIFQHEDIESGNLYLARALLCDVLEIDSFEFDVLSDDTSLTQFIRNAPLTYFFNSVQMGTYYVQKVERVSANKYRFTCTSTVGLLDETDHNGGIYTGQTVKEVVADICGPYPVHIKTNLQGIALYGWLPVASRRDNLSQVLFAIGATLKVDYNGVLRVEGLWSEQSGMIDGDHMYADGTIKYDAPITKVVVTEHQYTAGSEETKLFEGTTADGDKITFNEPHHSLVADGFIIREWNANYAIVSSGSGTLTGKKYVHTTRVVTRQVATAQADNIVKVDNATLVSLANAGAVADRLAAYYSCTDRVQNDMVLHRERPGDVVELIHPYDGGNVCGCVESCDVDLSGILRAGESVLLGYVPPEIDEAEYYDYAELLTENGTWIVPSSVTSIRVVLIGGGQGGAHGANGTDGTRSYSGGTGGDGGAGGNGGAGGKVAQHELTVNEGTIFEVSIGVGGNAASDTETQGEEGTATTFGSLSSDQGTASPNGFTDIISGETYGLPGSAGIAGGKGGDGGNSSRHGQDGEAVDDALGGVGGTTLVLSAGSWAGGGAGGGAAHQTAGSDGQNGKSGSLIDGGDAGNGATPPEAVSVRKRGSGGNGGHGGGGGGGGGGAYSINGSSKQWAGSGGTGGQGSCGSAGGDGCILIYYRIPKIVRPGKFMTRDGKILLDKNTRKLVV